MCTQSVRFRTARVDRYLFRVASGTRVVGKWISWRGECVDEPKRSDDRLDVCGQRLFGTNSIAKQMSNWSAYFLGGRRRFSIKRFFEHFDNSVRSDRLDGSRPVSVTKKYTVLPQRIHGGNRYTVDLSRDTKTLFKFTDRTTIRVIGESDMNINRVTRCSSKQA